MVDQKVTILLDDKPGHSNQALSLADIMKLDHVIPIKLEYNYLSLLPTILLSNTCIHIKNKTDILNIKSGIVISCGRRTSNVARFIKKNHPTVRIINIMWPELGYQDFDLIIAPFHDVINKKIETNNICTIAGSISNITPDFLRLNLGKWQKFFQSYKAPFISLIIGGNTKNTKFTISHAEEIIDFALAIAKKHDATILCSFSRRTPKNIKEFISNQLSAKHYIFDPTENDSENPYVGLLAISNIIIVTGDSISMCVDACSAGKIVYIYDDKKLIAAKHRIFLDYIFDANYALSFNDFDKNNTKCLNNNDVIIAKLKEQKLC
jgi:uncharacterized protein